MPGAHVEVTGAARLYRSVRVNCRVGHQRPLNFESIGVCHLSTKHFQPQLGTPFLGELLPRKEGDASFAIISFGAHGSIVLFAGDYMNLLELNECLNECIGSAQAFGTMFFDKRGKRGLNAFEMFKH